MSVCPCVCLCSWVWVIKRTRSVTVSTRLPNVVVFRLITAQHVSAQLVMHAHGCVCVYVLVKEREREVSKRGT